MSDSEKPKKRQLIQPRTLKGFRDYLPETMIPREQLIQQPVRYIAALGSAPSIHQHLSIWKSSLAKA